MEDLLSGLKAAGEPTRLRILAVLDRTELTVSELCQVLGQTQPRVSRHLRLLVEAGLLDRNAQGTSAFYRPVRSGLGHELYRAVLELLDPADPAMGRDLQRLEAIRAERAEKAARYFESVASDWDRMRDLHVADADVEQAMLDETAGLRIRDLLDVGTGTGRVLEVFADRIGHGVGVDLSRQMLDLARSQLDAKGHRHCEVRHADIYNLSLDAGSMDVAVLHHVLHFLDDPATAIASAARTLRPHGRLLIVDFASHGYEAMRAEFAHHWLGFDEETMVAWCESAGLVDVTVRHMAPPIDSDQQPITVTIWSATQHPDAPAVFSLDADSLEAEAS